MDVSGRLNLAESPEWLRVTPWLDLADGGVKSLHASIKGAPLRRRGAPIDLPLDWPAIRHSRAPDDAQSQTSRRYGSPGSITLMIIGL